MPPRDSRRAEPDADVVVLPVHLLDGSDRNAPDPFLLKAAAFSVRHVVGLQGRGQILFGRP